MDETMHFRTWQECLQSILENPLEKQRIAQAIRVNPVTLTRWAHSQSQPRAENLIALLQAIPSTYAEEFRALIEQADPAMAQLWQGELPLASAIPSEFYMRVLSAYASIPPSLYPRTLYDLILQQALEQLDPARRGLSISVVMCVPPLERRYVRSLREVVGIGTPPWERHLHQRSAFLGMESLSGFAVTRQRLVCLQSRQEQSWLACAQWATYEESAAASPITRQAMVAGCLLVSSTQPQYFTPALQTVIEHYANLMSLAFEAEQFFDPDRIQLQVLPPYEEQLPIVETFPSRVSRTLVEAAARHEFLPLTLVQRRVWQEIEEELLQYSPQEREC
jgi:hypothetical protein